MQISALDKYADLLGVLDVLTDGTRERIGSQMADHLKPFYSLTLEEFFACLRCDFSCIGLQRPEDLAEMSVAQGLWVERFAPFVEEFIKVCEALKPPQAPDEVTKVAGLKPCTFEEAALLFSREYFGLHSFTDAAKTTLGDYVIARKDTYNKALQTRAQIARYKKPKK